MSSSGSSPGQIFQNMPPKLESEQFSDLLTAPNVRIERIVSTGQATPAGEWLDQAEEEWVLLLRGAARLLFAGEASERELGPGDYVHIPARAKHRVEWTAPDTATIWLAVHIR